MECNFENCGYYVDEECTICGMGTDGEDTFCKYCKDNPNCYYKQLAELKAENEALIEGLGVVNKYVNKYHQTLQEIKEIAGKEIYMKQNSSMDRIIDLITKAEEE